MQASQSPVTNAQANAPDRKDWLELLCSSEPAQLRNLMAPIKKPDFNWLRKPQVGLYMVRGRVGGNGNPFNLGEVSVTRCVLRVESGSTGAVVGLGYTLGRKPGHAALCAIADAMLQDPETAGAIYQEVLTPLESARATAQSQALARAQATRVEFFSVARESGIGDSP